VWLHYDTNSTAKSFHIDDATRTIIQAKTLVSLAIDGINLSSDFGRPRNHIMFPVKEPSISNSTIAGAMGQHIPEGSIYPS
jgi:hypothetical protein